MHNDEIHPESRLGRLRRAHEAAQAAHEKARAALAELEVEASGIDRWLEAVDLDTDMLEYVQRTARRAILATVIARTEAGLADLAHAAAAQSRQYDELNDQYIEVIRELAVLEDRNSPLVQQLTFAAHQQRLNELQRWLREMTQV